MKTLNRHSGLAEPLQTACEPVIWRFSPNQTDPELLQAIFTGREHLLQNVLEKIADSATSGSTHHVLLHGPRGIGKSHFLSLLHHRVVSDPSLADTVRVAWLNEEETTTNLAQLLVRVYRSLCKRYPSEYSVDWLEELLDQPAEVVTGTLTRRLVARFENRKLVILIENLNVLFDHFGLEGQHQLRTLLQENPFACVIASSHQLFKAISDRSEPFFGFFQQIPLKPLTLEEARQLLMKIAEVRGQSDLLEYLKSPEGLSRVRAIHDVAGGNHRIYVVLSSFISEESLDQLVSPFQRMADDLTPYYQERLHRISPLQRQIVELLCREHRTINPKQMARRLLMDQRSIGKQVRLLEEMGYLTSTSRGRETFYELSEPLMRLAFEVKESLPGMFVDFLRVWYRQNESAEKTSQPPESIAKDEALTCSEDEITLVRDSAAPLFDQTLAYFTSNRWDDGFESIRQALALPRLDTLGDAASMFALIFQFSEDDAKLQSRLKALLGLYQNATPEAHRAGSQFGIKAISHLAAGLVRSLSRIDARRITAPVLKGYVTAVQISFEGVREFEIPMRLFRSGIRYLISEKEAEFVELIKPERRLLRQVFGLPEEG
jgi:DNA-binding MarR family transcriptional regulator